MASVDNRVVKMGFDNAQFEQKAAGTLDTLGKLHSSLDFSKTSQGLDDLSNASSKFSMDGMGNAVMGIADKFTAMSAVAFSVIQNITNRAVDAGSRIVKEFAIAPITDGFHEFETQMGAVQTILANTQSKGTTLDQVSGALDELNSYADKTIYNFTNMTDAVGKFTAAGVDLKTSVNSIKGFSNVAALAGAGAEKTAGAMVQLSQAVSSGTVRLEDWNSMTQAGVDTEAFRNSLIETAKVHGKNVDAMIKKEGSFRLSLSEGWLSSDIMTETLQKFTGELTDAELQTKGYTSQQIVDIQRLAKTANASATEVKTFTQLVGTLKEAVGSGWAKSFQIMGGDFNESKALFTGLSQTFGGLVGASADARNVVLMDWKAAGGRDAAIQGLRDVLWSLFSVVNTVKAALREIFPKKTGADFAQITKNIEDFLRKLIPTGEQLEKLKRIFIGVFSAIDIAYTVLRSIVGAIYQFVGSLDFMDNAAGGILDFFANIGDKIKEFRDQLKESTVIGEFLNKYFKIAADFINQLNLPGKIDAIVAKFQEFKDKVSSIFGGKDDMGGAMKGLAAATGVVTSRWDRLIDIAKKLGDVFSWIWEQAKKLGPMFKAIGDAIKNAFGGGNDFSGAFDALNAGILGGGLIVILKFFRDMKKEAKGFIGSVKDAIEGLTGVLSAMQQNVKADTLKKIAIALAILTVSIVVLSLIDSAKLTAAMVAVGAGIGLLVGAMKALDQVASGPKDAAKLAILAAGLTLLGGALLILAIAVKVLASIDQDKMIQGLVGLGTVMAMLTVMVNNLPKPKELKGIGDAIKEMAIGIALMAGVVFIFGSMPIEKMLQGLGGLAATMTLLMLTVNNLPKDMKKRANDLAEVGIALVLISGAVTIFSMMDMEKMVQGLVGIAATMAILAITMNVMPSDMEAKAAGLVAVAASLVIIAVAVKLFADMDMDKMIQGLIAVAAVMITLAIALNIMQGTVFGAVAMAIAAASLMLLYVAIKGFADLGLGTVALALVGVALAIGVIALAAVLLSEAVPFILALGAALLTIAASAALFGLAAVGIGLGIFLVVKAFEILNEIGVPVVEKMITILPTLATAAAKAILAFVGALLEGVPAIIEGLGKILLVIGDVLIQLIPKLGEVIIVLIDTLITIIEEEFPKLQQLGLDLLTNLLIGIRDNLPGLVTLVGEIITTFLDTLALELPYIIASGVNLLLTFLQGIKDSLHVIAPAVGDLITTFIHELDNNIQKIIDAGGDLIIHFIEGIGLKLFDIIATGTNILIALMSGITSNVLKITNATADLIITFLDEFRKMIDTKGPEIREKAALLAGAIINGLTGGLAEHAKEVVDKLLEIAKNAFQGIKDFFHIGSPSKLMKELGGFIIAGLVIGLDENNGKAVDSATSLGTNVMTALQSSLADVSATAAQFGEFNPTIKPVLDLTGVQKGASEMDSLLKTPTIDATVSFTQAASLAVATKDQEKTTVDETQTPPPPPAVQDVKFEQHIYAPTALSTNDIYRNTKSQIALAKEELKV